MAMKEFGTQRKVIAMLLLLLFMGIIASVNAYEVNESEPIGMKWVKLGGMATVGLPTSDVLTTPNGAAQYQKFEDCVIVYSNDWGAVVITLPIFDKWFSLQGQTDVYGHDLFDYIGVPIEDYSVEILSPVSKVLSGTFTRGIIVNHHGIGGTYVIYGDIYLHYSEIKSIIGWPLSDESSVAGGRYQVFRNGEIYYKPGVGAFEVHDPIRQRWLDLGGPGGSMGFPLSDEIVLNTYTPGSMNRFEGGNIYNSSQGTWEVTGEICNAYEKQYGGPAGPLGYPILGQGTTPTSGGVFNDFEGGMIVHHSSGIYNGTYAFMGLKLYVDKVVGYGDDCWEGVCGDQDVYARFKVSLGDTLFIDKRIPKEDNGGVELLIHQTWDIYPLVWSFNNPVTVWVRVWDQDLEPNNDDQLGTISKTYSVDNLWGIFDSSEHSASEGDGSCKVWFLPQRECPINYTDFPGQLSWSFRNFETSHLSYEQYALTFSDVNPEESWWLNPFNAAYYEIYEDIAEDGNCFGISLESVNAEKSNSMYSEPIFDYFPDTQEGAELTPIDDAHKDLISVLNVKQGYQLGAPSIDWSIDQFLSGNTHDPIDVFENSRDAYSKGDDAIIAIYNSYMFSGGHAVVPYKWDDTTNPDKWRMYVADSNNPAGAPGYTPSYIEIDRSNGNHWTYYPADLYENNYEGGEWTGGRMLYIPYHILSYSPSTPFWDIFELLGHYVFLIGDTGQANQISDDAGHTFYEPGLVGPPTRWDQIVQDDAARIPNLGRVGLIDAESGDTAPELYFGRGEGATEHYETLPRVGVAEGTPYDCLFSSGTLSAHMIIPGTSGVSDVITIKQIGTPNQAVSLSIPAVGEAKEVEWTMYSGEKGRWAKLTELNMVPSQSIELRLANGGYDLKFQNSGPETTAWLEVQSNPSATPVIVGDISIPTGASNFQFGVPVATLTYSEGQIGEEGWLLTPIVVTLQAADYSGTGIDYIEYSLNGTTWTHYSDPFTYAEEGETTLYYRAKDLAGNQGAVKTQDFKIDTQSPNITITLDKPFYTRDEPFTVNYSVFDPIPGSGLANLAATLDGETVTDGQTVNIMSKSLGTHTVTVNASDVAGLNTTKSASFEIVATFDSLESIIIELRRMGEIDSDGIEESLLAMVNAANNSQQRGQEKSALNQLNALMNEIGALSRKKHITEYAADLLAADIQYVMEHPP